MKTVEEIKAELKSNKHALSSQENILNNFAITDSDKIFSQMEANKRHHIISALEWVLNESNS